MPYVFENLDSPNRQAAPGDQELSEAMAAYWTNFAKRGDPNGAGLPNWPAFSDANPEVMYLKQPPHTGPVPSEAGLQGLEEYFAWRRTPEGEAFVQPNPQASAGTAGNVNRRAEETRVRRRLQDLPVGRHGGVRASSDGAVRL